MSIDNSYGFRGSPLLSLRDRLRSDPPTTNDGATAIFTAFVKSGVTPGEIMIAFNEIRDAFKRTRRSSDSADADQPTPTPVAETAEA
jgi:hypothetical protein